MARMIAERCGEGGLTFGLRVKLLCAHQDLVKMFAQAAADLNGDGIASKSCVAAAPSTSRRGSRNSMNRAG